MKTISSFVTTIAICFILFTGIGLYSADSAEPDETIEGNWMGKLGDMRVVFRITKSEDGSFTAFMDSPDQFAFDIPVNKIVFENGNVRLDTKSIGCFFEGKVHEDSIDGGLKSLAGGGGAVPIVFKRVDEVPDPPRRPQTPKKPYPYEEEEVVYENKVAGINKSRDIRAATIPTIMPCIKKGPRMNQFEAPTRRITSISSLVE